MLIEQPRSKVGVHLATAGVGVGVNICVGVKLCKELFNAEPSDSHKQGLIAIVSRAEVSLFEVPCKYKLRQLLTVSENAKFGFPGQDFFSSEQGHLPAYFSQFVFLKNLLLVGLGIGFRF